MSRSVYAKEFACEDDQKIKVEVAASGRLILWINDFGVVEGADTIFGGQMLARDLSALRYALGQAEAAIGDHIADKIEDGEMR